MESGWGSVIVQLRRTNTEGVARKVFLIIRDLAATFLGATRIKSSAETCWGVFCYQDKKREYMLNFLRTTLSNGYLGSGNDEERSEMRYEMRIAEFSESSNLRTQIALPGYPWEHASSRIA